jgi:uncharacterized protein (TIGR02466 family)
MMCKANQINELPEPVDESAIEVKLESLFHFPVAIYKFKAPQFLASAKEVTDEALAARMSELKTLNEIYPLVMTGNLHADPRMRDLSTFIQQVAWDILDDQGYDMRHFGTYFTEFWCQEHHKHSAMEQHVHGYGSQIVGFYFIEVPEGSSKVLFHDPRAGKVQLNLPEKDMTQATIASNVINFDPEPGMCMFTNAWLAHSFTRHAASKPIRFIHFNVSVQTVAAPTACSATEVEVI